MSDCHSIHGVLERSSAVVCTRLRLNINTGCRQIVTRMFLLNEVEGGFVSRQLALLALCWLIDGRVAMITGSIVRSNRSVSEYQTCQCVRGSGPGGMVLTLDNHTISLPTQGSHRCNRRANDHSPDRIGR